MSYLIDPQWRTYSQHYSHSIPLIQKYYQGNRATHFDYIVFQDYFSVTKKDPLMETNGEYLFYKPHSFFQFDLLFQPYNLEVYDTFKILYEMSVKYRMNNSDFRVANFYKFLQTNTISEEEKNQYYNLNFLLRY